MYRICYSPLMSVCSRYEKNKEDAEELLNLAFYKILTKIDKYSDGVPFEAWIRRITINTIIDEFRKKSRDKHLFLEKLEGHVPVDSMDFNEAEQRFDAEELEEMIRQLPPVSQKVFNMYVVEGYNHKEIAEMLGISEGTSKWHLSTARKNVKQMLLKIINKVASIIL
ncbi:MAG: sigma-70 family RNA polymerase sigma factor [Bacteroidota bacterium]|nr:sigma-70 family RNA polymerase sigma factor [Bacteroidota bacterium]MDX5428363.1 sigma-70 family RNA polymerase sigma factor [Bacteroidota bacterium]MDX5447574.1 sigma-70 family RNA polymerase sigma factor [Bacteroidota bacterium]MDX5506136.1 sigma-70 family RNA polymerase sigma factor [Bacteroidota bacterium]